MQELYKNYKLNLAPKPKNVSNIPINNNDPLVAEKRVIQKEIAKRFRSLRKAAFYSQEEIGNIIGVSFQQVQKYETATDRIPVTSLYLLAKHFNISIKEFFPDSTANPSNILINNRVWVMARNLMAIKDPTVRKKIFSLLSALAKSHT